VRRVLLAGFVAGASALAVSCASSIPEPSYLDARVGFATTEEIDDELGQPAASIEFEGGDTVWTYRFGDRERCWDYALHFDADGVLGSWERSECSEPPVPDQAEQDTDTLDDE
jgi:hypothetical protein